MPVDTIVQAVDKLNELFESYRATTLVTIAKIYQGGVDPLMAEFPCLIIKAETESREIIRAAGRSTYSRNREFRILVGVFSYIQDIDLAYREATGISDEILNIIETDTNINTEHSLGYDVDYDGDIEYGTGEFGGDQTFCFGVMIPLRIKVTGKR
jgi:hypothetical protein